MVRLLTAWFRSLELRLFVPLALTAGVVLAVHSVIGYRSTKAHFAGFVQAETERSSGLIKGATHDGMLLNRLDEVQATIERLSEAPEVASIRVYDTNGRIVLSAAPEERGRLVERESTTCRTCHEGVATPERTVLQRRLAGAPGQSDILQQFTVIPNEEGCAAASCHYHPPDKPVLGLLEVGMSMGPFDEALARSQERMIWTTVLLVLVSGLVVAMFIRKVVHTPVERLRDGARRIASGDLSTRIEVRGDHELARLAEAFNQMTEELDDARREVLEWSQTLEQKVEAKTRELQAAERQVLHMETMASLGKLSATVAHELNNPLTGVRTYAKLVKRELEEQPVEPATKEKLERYLALVDKECARCGAIVHNLLTFARRRGSAMAPVDVNEVVERSLMLVRHHLEMRDIALEAQTLPEETTVLADAGQLEQALLAILMNAVEAMASSPDARLGVRVQADAGSVQFEVSDTGVGIAPEDLPHIFEPFFSTKGEESGVGLGLAVVYGIVNRHGGTVEVASEPGRGTTFRVRIPREGPGGADRIGADAQEQAPAPN